MQFLELFVFLVWKELEEMQNADLVKLLVCFLI